MKKYTLKFLTPFLLALATAGCASTRRHSLPCVPPSPTPDSALICVYRVADSAPSSKAGVLLNDREIGRLPKNSGVWLLHEPGDVTIAACIEDGRYTAVATNRLACAAGSAYFLRLEFRKVLTGKDTITISGPGETVTPLVVGGISNYRHQPLLRVVQEQDARADLGECVDVPARVPNP